MDILLNDFDKDENYYQRISDDMMFYNEFVQQEIEMEQYVNEHIILASGNIRAINEMMILTEAKVTDKIKAFFEKIKNFFKAIFARIGEGLNKWIKDLKQYIDKYADIINNKKFIVGNVSMLNHFKGYKRITDTIASNILPETLNTFADKKGINNLLKDESDKINIDNILSVFSGDDASKITELKNTINKNTEDDKNKIREKTIEIIIESIRSDDDDELIVEKNSNNVADSNITFLNWFNGSSEEENFTVDDIEKNFKYIVSIVYGSDEYLAKLESMKTNYLNVFNKIENVYEQTLSNLKTKVDTMITNSKVDVDKEEEKEEENAPASQPEGENTSTTNNKEDQSSFKTNNIQNRDGMAKATDKKDKKIISSYTDDNGNKVDILSNSTKINGKSYYNEIKITKATQSSSSSSSNNKDTVSNYISDKQTISQANTANADIKKTNINVKIDDKDIKNNKMKNINDKNVQNIKKDAEDVLTIISDNIIDTIKIVSEVFNSVTSAMFQGFKNTQIDYFAIIRAHVKSYLNQNKNNSTENNVNRGKNNKSLPSGTPISKREENTTEEQPTTNNTQQPTTA